MHQFNCTCVDHQIKGNFCKHIHACIRISKRDDFFSSINETVITSDFEVHSNQVVNAAQCQTSHLGDSVPMLSRLESIFNVTLSIAQELSEEELKGAVSRAQSNLDTLRQLLADKKKTSVSTDFSKLPKNLPSHKKIDKQRFHSTKKQRTPSDRKLAKPSALEKASIMASI